jgi:hypothetical protein
VRGSESRQAAVLINTKKKDNDKPCLRAAQHPSPYHREDSVNIGRREGKWSRQESVPDRGIGLSVGTCELE